MTRIEQNQEKPYILGQQNGGVRIVDTQSVADSLATGNVRPDRFSCSRMQLEQYESNLAAANGRIDDFKQALRGDCYFLAAVKSLALSEDGQQLLAQNIKANSDGSYTISLPGAKVAKQWYNEKGFQNECLITGEYTITKSAIDKVKNYSGNSYAYGDFEVILLELAMEAFRAEVNQTIKNTGVATNDIYSVGQTIEGDSDADVLSSGHSFDAVYVLTGKKSDFYFDYKKQDNPLKLYRYGEYGYTGQGYNLCSVKSVDIGEIENHYNSDSDLQKMLDKCMGHEEEYAITFGVIVAEDGPDGTTKAGGGHALSVKKITKDYVEVINPWDTTKIERIPRGDFEMMAKSFTVTKLKPEPSLWERFTDWTSEVYDDVCDWFTDLFGSNKEEPEKPEPVDPKPTDPEPVDPIPVNPTPVDPTPVDPEPVDPTPDDPTPVNPNPVDPAPENPIPDDPEPETPENKTYTVVRGDSLWKIAKNLLENPNNAQIVAKMEEIILLNNLTYEADGTHIMIHPGDTLIIK